MGDRLARIAVGVRHDAVVALAVDRWQELIGPRVTLEGLDPLADATAPVAAQCVQGCDVQCPDRLTTSDLRVLMDAPLRLPEPPRVEGPRGVRDRRGEGTVVATLAALAGADRGVVAVVADVAQRRATLADVLEPGRLGVEVAVLGGGRCDVAAFHSRLAQATARPALVLLEYAMLPSVTLPDDIHLALVDPPPDPESAGWVRAHAAARWLHLLWGDEEVAFANRVALRSWELRPIAGELWKALSGSTTHEWGPQLDALLLGSGDPMRAPVAVAHALRALAEIGLLEVDGVGVHVRESTGARLEASPRAIACAARLREIKEFLASVGTLMFDGSAVSCGDVRAAG
jgi:hypothetical protein